MSSIEVAAAAITPPGDTYVRTATAAGEVLRLPDTFDGNWISIQADTDDLYIKFGTTALSATPVIATLSAIGPPVVAAADGCVMIPAGTHRDFYLRDFIQLTGQSIFLGHITPFFTSGFIRFFKSSGPRDL
jgi:hypothetical protein